MILRDVTIFFVIQVAMALFAFAEAYMEGPNGWKWNPKWWRINLPGGFTLNSYHVFVFGGMFPLFLSLPLVMYGWDRHVFLVLLFSYVVGIILEDFLWFVVNPDYPFRKWNPKETRWYPWVRIGKFAIPLPYVFVLFVSGLLISLIL